MAQLQIQPNRLGIANQLPHDNGSTSRGSKVLRTSGNSLIAMGITEIILTIVLIVVPTFYCYLFSFVIFAFSSSVLAIVTGSFGRCSERKRCRVIAYLVLGIITAIVSAVGVLYTTGGVSCAFYELRDYYTTTSGEDKLEAALYVILCIIFGCQIVVSIIGASFTCKVICAQNRQMQQVIVYQPNQVPYQITNAPQAFMVITTDNANQQLGSPPNCQANPPDYKDIMNI